MVQFFEVLFGGIAQAAVYSLMAVGLSLVYGTARTLNFAHGSLYTTGAYISWVLTAGYLGLPLWAAIIVLIPILFGLGAGIERFMLRPLRSNRNWKITAMMVTLGLAFVLDNANLIMFGSVAKPMPAFIEGSVSIFGIIVPSYRIAVLVIALAIVVLLEIFLNGSRFGWAVRAVAQDIQGARQVGIDVNRIFAFTFGLSVVLTGLAGLLLSPIFLISPQGGWEPFLKAFVIVVLGGLGSTRGAVAAAFVLGLIEAVVVYKLGANWTMPVWLVTLLLVLMIRPQGLMGSGQNRVFMMTAAPETVATEPKARKPPAQWMQMAYWTAVAGLALCGALITDSYVQHVLILCFLWCMVAAAWDLTLGYAGIFNYAQIALFAFGAYATGMLTLRLGIPPVAAVALATALTGLLGLMIALPCLRLQGEYVALFTFSVHLAMPPLIQLAKPLGTGGTMGLLGIPPIQLFGITFGPMNKIGWYYLALAAAAITVYLIYFGVLRSRTGRAFVALRDSAGFARSLGVNAFKYKLLAIVLSALMTGFAGALYAHYTSVVTPKILGNEFILLVIVMMAIGGIGRFPGAVLGAFVITVLNELLRDAGTYRLLILGMLVVMTLLLLPNGLVSLWERLRRIMGARRGRPARRN